MKLTHESYGIITTIETDHDDTDMEEMITHVRHLLLAIGFHPDTIKEYLEDY